MNFVTRYILSQPEKAGTDSVEFHNYGVTEKDHTLQGMIHQAVYDITEDEFTGVLFSYNGTMYEIRPNTQVSEDEWLCAIHSGGSYWFTLLSGDGSGWWEDLLIIARTYGTANAASWWPVTNP